MLPPSPSPSARRPIPRILPPLAGALAVLSAVALGVLAAHVLAARAATQPTLTVTLQSSKSTDTQSQYQAAAAGFASQTQITVTFGDGSGIAPLSATTDSAGGFTSFWTLNATNKYCGTLTATDGTNTASASFWVALATDTQSGTACGGATTAPSATAAASVAPTQTTASPATTQAPAPPPPAVSPPQPSGSSLGARVQRVIARIPGGLATVIAGSIVAILVLLGLIGLVLFSRNRGEESAQVPLHGMPPARGGLTPAGLPTRRTPGVIRAQPSRHPYDVDNGFNGNMAAGPGSASAWSNGPMRAPQRASLTDRPSAGPVRTPPPWVGDPGATPGRTGSYRMPTNRSARHVIPQSPAAQRWDRSRPGARIRRDAPTARDEDWPPDPDYR